MMALNTKVLKNFIKLATDQLEGDWIIFGGTVLPLLGIDVRATVDIDFVSKNKVDATLKLIQIADQLGLPMATINQAGAFYLYKIADYQKNLILVSQGKKGSVFRPNLFLFIQLKIDRLSDSDLIDCIEYHRYSKKHNEAADSEKIKTLLQRRIKTESRIEKLEKLKKILELF